MVSSKAVNEMTTSAVTEMSIHPPIIRTGHSTRKGRYKTGSE